MFQINKHCAAIVVSKEIEYYGSTLKKRYHANKGQQATRFREPDVPVITM